MGEKVFPSFVMKKCNNWFCFFDFIEVVIIDHLQHRYVRARLSVRPKEHLPYLEHLMILHLPWRTWVGRYFTGRWVMMTRGDGIRAKWCAGSAKYSKNLSLKVSKCSEIKRVRLICSHIY